MSKGRGSGRGSGNSSQTNRLHVRVKTARGRKSSSTRWLQRQLNDPYVERAKKEGYRSRAAFKLLELDERFGLLKPGYRVVDLGAAPGGWLQVAVRRGASKVVGIDLLPIEPLAGADILTGDFLEEGADDEVRDHLGGEADVVLSDMAANATGHRQTDHLKIMALAEAAAHFARQVLRPGGHFVAKVLRGGTENELLAQLKQDFEQVKHVKPQSSRQDSAEIFVVATGFRGHGEPR